MLLLLLCGEGMFSGAVEGVEEGERERDAAQEKLWEELRCALCYQVWWWTHVMLAVCFVLCFWGV